MEKSEPCELSGGLKLTEVASRLCFIYLHIKWTVTYIVLFQSYCPLKALYTTKSAFTHSPAHSYTGGREQGCKNKSIQFSIFICDTVSIFLLPISGYSKNNLEINWEWLFIFKSSELNTPKKSKYFITLLQKILASNL